MASFVNQRAVHVNKRPVHRARPRRPHPESKAHGLQDLLAQSFQSYRDTHLAHFNVTGPSFPQLHVLFDAQYNELWLALDKIAERIRALGEAVEDTAFAVVATPLPDDANKLVRHLAAQHRRVATACRAVEEAAQVAKDTGTADLAVERMQAHQKHAWMLEATAGERSVDVVAPARRLAQSR